MLTMLPGVLERDADTHQYISTLQAESTEEINEASLISCLNSQCVFTLN